MTKRLLFSYLTITIVVLLMLELPLGLFYAQRERERLTGDVERDASVIATLYEDDLQNGTPLDSIAAQTYHDRTGARVVVVDDQGISQVDTGGPVPRDFSTRPEIATALAGSRASGTRASDTLSTDLLYVAVPVASGGTVLGALRLTLDMRDVNARIRSFWIALAGIAAVVLLVVAVIGWVIARSVTRPLRNLTETAGRFASGDLEVAPSATRGPPEIRALDATMTTMAVQLDGLLSSNRAFVADASHQLRTPLTALRLRLENLQSHLDEVDHPVSVDDEVERAVDEISRLTELVTNLLQLARADDHPPTALDDLHQLTCDRVDTWTAVAEEREVMLTGPAADAGAITVRTVPGAIEQILDNVLDNALLVAPPGSTVSVDVALNEMRGQTPRLIRNVATVTIVDHGPGLSDADKRDAMNRFWRGDTTRPGTGLGLAIVDALASASGGSVSLTDTPGGGLTVVIDLPLAASR